MIGRRELLCCLALPCLALGVACNKSAPTAPAAAPTTGGLPPLEGGAVAVAEGVPANPHAGNPHGGGMPPMPGGMPATNPHGGATPPMPGEPATPGGIPFDEKSVLSGELQLTDATRDKVKAGDTIFFVVRAAPADGSPAPGPILAVKRADASAKFPQKFAIDGRDAMIPGTALSGKVVVMVRVDKDANATTKNPGDVVGQTAVISPPQTKLVVSLDKVL